MVCLLCQRQFPNKEGLLRHQHLSDLHKVRMGKQQAFNLQGAMNILSAAICSVYKDLMQNLKAIIDLILSRVYICVNMIFTAAFNCYSKTWKFRENQNSQKLSWRSWRGKKLRYLTQ